MWDLKAVRIPGAVVSLNAIAKATLNETKLGKSVDAPAMSSSGKLQELANYCQQDVTLLKQIYEFGCKKGYTRIKDYEVPVRWLQLAQLLEKKKRHRGPRFEPECLEAQETMLADTPSCDLKAQMREWQQTRNR